MPWDIVDNEEGSQVAVRDLQVDLSPVAGEVAFAR